MLVLSFGGVAVPRPLRVQSKESIYFVTNRCLQRRFLLTPSPKLNRIILGCLGRAVCKHGVKLFAYVFMSNHFHMVVRAPRLNLHAFLMMFQSSLAREVNRLLGRTGTVFPKPFTSPVILDDVALEEKLLYILMNPVHAGLVEHPADWPGVISWEPLMSAAPVRCLWLDRTWLGRMRRKTPLVPEIQACKSYEFELEGLPHWSQGSPQDRAARLSLMVEEACGQARHQREAEGGHVKGAEAVMSTAPTSRPQTSPQKTPCPPCHTSCRQRRKQFLLQRRAITDAYKVASARWRAAWQARGPGQPFQARVRFPPGTIAPTVQKVCWDDVCGDFEALERASRLSRGSPGAHHLTRL